MGVSALRRVGRAALWLVALPALCAAAAPASAGDPGLACRTHQLAAAKKLYKASLSCWAKAFKSPSFDPFVCLIKPELSFRKAYASAAAKAAKKDVQCGLRLDVESLLSLAAGDVDPIAGAISIDANFDDLLDLKKRGKLIAAAAGFAGKAFAAQLAFAKKGDESKRSAAFAAAQAKLDKVFAAEAKALAKKGIEYGGLPSGDVGEALGKASALWERLTRADNGAFTLAGTIFAAESTFVDWDVNDTSTEPIYNGSFFAAQPLPTPATVGGYVNLSGAGPTGNSRNSGDLFDTYHAHLNAGQVVVLVLGDDPSVVKLDLCLYGPTNPNWNCAPNTTDRLKLLVAPIDGDYFIDVSPVPGCNCGGTYTLSIGQTVPPEAARAERTDVEFVPGELIVRLRDPAPVALAGEFSAAQIGRPQPAPGLPSEFGLEKVAGDASREFLLRLPTGAARARSLQALGAGAEIQKFSSDGESEEQQARRETLLALAALRERPEVASVSLNTIFRPSFLPNDDFYTYQWNYPLINLPQAWDLETGSPSVIVAVVDTGVRLDHPDLQGQLVAGYDFISDPSRARDGNGIDSDPNDPGDLGSGAGSSFHGTHVAGTIAAATNNGIGVAGIAFGARVMPIRVLGRNGGTFYDVLQGVRYAARLPNDSLTLPSKRADVINLSLGGGGFDQAFQDLVDAARAAGVIVVAAAGNDNTSAPSFPASYAGVVSVAAVDLNRTPAPYSNFGPSIDIAAPGGDTSVDRNGDTFADGVLSTLADDSGSAIQFGYAFYQGTSMATPHVSGVFALMRSVNSAITPAQIDTLLTQGKLTQDLGTPGRDNATGWGLVDARAAVIAAGAPDTTPAALNVTPSGLNYGLVLGELGFVLANASSDPLSVSSVSDDATWLTVTAQDVDGDGLGTYLATVDRSGLDDGTYSATISITSSAGTSSLPVVMRVGGPSSSDAGFHYVLLVDADALVPIAELDASALNGSYTYAFHDIPPGNYAVVAGSDMDDDGFICDGGEACGSYPTLDLPTPVALDHDVVNADFGTAFRQTIGAGVSAKALDRPIPVLRRRAR